MKQRTSKKSKLEKDLEGKPRITLKPLKKTFVHTPTQKDYLNLMRIYECGEWRWIDGDLPTKSNLIWNAYEEETCIRAGSRFGYADKKYCEKVERYKVISTKKFYDKQKITSDMLGEINSYFETKK